MPMTDKLARIGKGLLSLSKEQRKALNTIMLAGAGPLLTGFAVFAMSILTWADLLPDQLHYVGSMGIIVLLLLVIPLVTYGVDAALRNIQAGWGGFTFNASGEGAGDEEEEAPPKSH